MIEIKANILKININGLYGTSLIRYFQKPDLNFNEIINLVKQNKLLNTQFFS